MDISVGIVAYNALGPLRGCLDSLATQRDAGEVEVILVDNASAEPVAATVAGEYPAVKLIASPDNLGFAGGTNRAFAEATGRLLLWLNPDTELPAPDVLARLRARFEAEPGLGALGCRLLLPDGSPQRVGGARPTAGRELLDLFHLAPGTRSDRLEYLSGACLLTSAEVWRRVGGLDEGYFMYLEDVDWCRRVTDAGCRLALADEVTVLHHEGASYGDKVFLRREHYWRSLVRYLRRHDGAAAAGALRLGLAVTALPKLAAAALGDRSPQREARRRFLAAQLALGLRGV